MAARKHPTGPPPSAGVLAKYVQAYAREAGLSEGRVRGWISYMVMAGALERAAASGQPRFTVKGGIALAPRRILMSCCNTRTPIWRERSKAL